LPADLVLTWGSIPTMRMVLDMAGTWFATARIADVRPPIRERNGWHVASSPGSPPQFGIVLTDVRVLGTWRSATGGLGFYRFEECATCARPCAVNARHKCKSSESVESQTQMTL
jgi:hypothetical protein